MTDLLISVILAGTAVTFVIEFLFLITLGIFFKEKIYQVLTLPLSFGAMYVFSDIYLTFAVTVPATAFLALMLNKYLNTSQVTSTRLKRL